MKPLRDDALYALLAYIARDGAVIDQRPLPTQTFEQIYLAASHPFAVAKLDTFYLFAMSHLALKNSVPHVTPSRWTLFRTREAAIAAGVEAVSPGTSVCIHGH